MNAFLLQIKGDASFSLFSQVTDVESLSQTWKLCSKVAGHLEQGKRLENLSWRLFHLHAMMTGESPNNRTHTFERLSKETGRKLDRERHLRLSQLQAPPLKRGRCANQPMSSVSATIHHPTLLCSLSSPMTEMGTGGLVNCTTITSSTHINFSHYDAWDFDFKAGSINFESFLSSFSPLALFGPVDYLSQETCCLPENTQAKRMADSTAVWDSVNCLPYHEQLNAPSFANTERTDLGAVIDPVQHTMNVYATNPGSPPKTESPLSEHFRFDNIEAPTDSPGMQFVGENPILDNQITSETPQFTCQSDRILPAIENINGGNSFVTGVEFPQQKGQFSLGKASKPDISTNAKNSKVGEKRKRRNPMATRLPTFVGASDLPKHSLDGSISDGPICFNCRGTQTPLWRRGPNDELLCNACGVFYKVHKKHRPATLSKYNRSLGNSNSVTRNETDPKGTGIQCTNCDATATPMWRKAPDGSLLCNACALYVKCHKRPRPTNSSKVSLTRPLGLINSLSNLNYGNEPTYSLGITSPKSEIYISNPSSSSDLSSPFINLFDNTLGGSSEFSSFNYFKSFPNSCYTTHNT
ncbi:hypothetical protein PtA15_9A463 [Puccinia triticina]|nr:uncharacterized protein PtA15_9A463 [Puccinia triticina]WAQ88336.1 hypothetical protein PtA15_9A463 [Puccinia triticina]WAR60517.1 hypothetical protein PtB15_9B456 [Puccinia triticina]